MARSKNWLPEEVADGTRYVLEACGQDKSGAVLVQRYVEFPDENVIMLGERKATSYRPKRKHVGSASRLHFRL
jgi:hypothetical protein